MKQYFLYKKNEFFPWIIYFYLGGIRGGQELSLNPPQVATFDASEYQKKAFSLYKTEFLPKNTKKKRFFLIQKTGFLPQITKKKGLKFEPCS